MAIRNTRGYSISGRRVGINTEIVNLLEDYDKEIPIDYLAKELYRSRPEIQGYVQKLENQGIVRLHNDHVSIEKHISKE